MLDPMIEALDAPPAKTEETIWETRSWSFEKMDDSPLVVSDERIAVFYGSATEMAPSLVERGGLGLVLRRSEPRYLNIHHTVARTGKPSDRMHYFALNDPFQGPPAGDAPSLARALLILADNPAIREIAAGSRLDPVAIDEMVRGVYSLLGTVEASSGSIGIKEGVTGRSDVGFVSEQITADTTFLDSLVGIPDLAQISADADRLAEEFLLFPASINTNPDILSAVDKLMERHKERPLGDDDTWSEQLSEKLSRFTD